MRRFFTSLVIREMQVEIMRYHFTPMRMAKIKNLTTLNPDMDGEQLELSFIVGGNAKLCSHSGIQSGCFS